MTVTTAGIATKRDNAFESIASNSEIQSVVMGKLFANVEGQPRRELARRLLNSVLGFVVGILLLIRSHAA